MRRLVLLALLTLCGSAALPAPAAGRVDTAEAAPATDPDWVWPLPPPHEVVRGFDPPAERWLAGHRGVDLRGHQGERVLAAGAGVVAFAGRVAGVPVVSIRHPDGLLTTYQPVVAAVTAGDEVRAGDRIGRLSVTASHCAPAACLHWGLRRDGPGRDDDYLDPLLLVTPTLLRLLPVTAASPAGA